MLAGEEVGNVGPDGEPAETPTLDTLAREGARRMLIAALLEAEVRADGTKELVALEDGYREN